MTKEEALTQKPNSDAISRQVVLEVIRKCHCEEWVKANIGASIEVLSPVAPQPKTGHWIKNRNLYKCTVCNDLCVVAGWADFIPKEQMYKTFKFCPNCGAKMEVEK